MCPARARRASVEIAPDKDDPERHYLLLRCEVTPDALNLSALFLCTCCVVRYVKFRAMPCAIEAVVQLGRIPAENDATLTVVEHRCKFPMLCHCHLVSIDIKASAVPGVRDIGRVTIYQRVLTIPSLDYVDGRFFDYLHRSQSLGDERKLLV